MAKHDIVAQVISKMPGRKPVSWWYFVAPEHQSTLDTIKQAFLDGKFGAATTTAGKGISAYLKEHGIADIGYQGVIAWLEHK